MATSTLGAVSPRTVRRMTAEGLLRQPRGRRRRSLPASEVEYLGRHGQVLTALRRVLRTERSVGAAVLFGSFARGDDGPDSDVDVAVLYRVPVSHPTRLLDTLTAAADRRIDLVDWDTLRESPEMALAVARDGRPLVDREGVFPALREDRENLRRRASRLKERQWRAIERLWGA